ncbi:2-hydroxyacid dehydrogenase [Novosphingobium sp. FSY-8]|uniref:2-hydroxyacid dehydrogenase n=1 Tax=Novosphingobium ovatum TaxID=1908523 RepID=A0ABW9XDQ8_9SPHN|nr:2-hydroxyacid dehydrogenase [Novosphingobium ovatum]NBC36637.1 2-hydroxyacid dehydrogenase [Novosphingobium ovatum]
MTASLPLALQLCPLSPYLEQALGQRVAICRWFELDGAGQAAWLAAHAGDVRAVLTGGHIGCPADLMQALPALGLIAINGVGFDKVDLKLAAARGVLVGNTPDVLTDDVADLAVGLVIGLLRDLAGADAYVRAGHWGHRDWPLARKVSGRRFGIVGLGRIGAAIARRLEPFGPVSYCGTAPKDVAWAYHPDAATLAAHCDVLVVACAANAATQGLINADVLAALGPQGYLVNVARGSVVDEAALAQALAAGHIAGAALDVFADEPNVPDSLLACDNTFFTPHIASATVETRLAMADLVLANLDAFLAGRDLPARVV